MKVDSETGWQENFSLYVVSLNGVRWKYLEQIFFSKNDIKEKINDEWSQYHQGQKMMTNSSQKYLSYG